MEKARDQYSQAETDHSKETNEVQNYATSLPSYSWLLIGYDEKGRARDSTFSRTLRVAFQSNNSK